MPSPYVVRNFTEGGVYHISNRAIENRTIFTFEDFKTFLRYLYIYVKPLTAVKDTYPDTPERLKSKNLSSEVDVLAYCLMPSHFHLILRQHTKDGVTQLMKQLTNAYTEYFNKKYKRTGPLFAGRFKAVPLDVDKTLIPVSRYIHLNPQLAGLISNSDQYPWSSLLHYIDGNIESVCKKRVILSFFTSAKHYTKYVQDVSGYEKELSKIKRLLLEEPEAFKSNFPDQVLASKAE